jgi:hypothetical protein
MLLLVTCNFALITQHENGTHDECLSFFLILPIRCMCRWLILQLITMTHIYTHLHKHIPTRMYASTLGRTPLDDGPAQSTDL